MVIANDHYQSIGNCLFVSNQGAFNMLLVSGRSALINNVLVKYFFDFLKSCQLTFFLSYYIFVSF